MNRYSLKSFALLWMSIFIVSFLGFIYIALNLFFSEHIVRSSLKDLRYTAHVAKLVLSEEQEKMKNSIALHVTSKEFISLLVEKDYQRVNSFIENWKSLLGIESIELYNNNGILMDLSSGVVSADDIKLSPDVLAELESGYEKIRYIANAENLIISVQRKIVDGKYHPQGYLIERKKIPYSEFLEKGEGRDLLIKSSIGVIYASKGVEGAKRLSSAAFAKGASAFELSLGDKTFDVFRQDLIPGISFFFVKNNLKSAVFKKFYVRYLAYFAALLCFLILIFYLSYYRQVFFPLEQISKFIVEGKRSGELSLETSVYEINLIAQKLEERIVSLNDDVEENKKGRVEDMSRLVASVAHELNNSLSYLGGNLDYLKEELDSDDEINIQEYKDAISSAQSGYERIKKIVSDLRVFSSKRELSIGWKSILVLHDKIMNEFKGVQLGLPAELKFYEVEVDLDRTFQIIKNLIINAEQAYNEKEIDFKILVSFYLDEQGFVVSVKDWAGGIPQEVKDKIFEPFYTTKKTIGGAGLGLSLSKNLAHEMNADLFLKETNSEGSVFCFRMKHFRSKG